MIRGTNPCQNTQESLSRALGVVDCCLAEGREDLAIDLIEKIEAFPIAQEGAIATRIRLFRDRKKIPSKLIQGFNFSSAFVRWLGAGLPVRTKKQISDRLKICKSCPFLVEQRCTRCGCYCVETEQLINKLALATEKCPEGKWE